MNEFLKTEIIDTILIITINRPSKLNALNRSVIGELGEVFRQAKANEEVKAILITGEGENAFAAGADISEFQEYPVEEATLMAKRGHEVFNSIENYPKPVLAVVNGFCLGGGCELAMACHMRVCSPNAKFGQPEVNLGLIPGYGGTQRLSQLIGKGKAMEFLLTGDIIGADEAKELGLVNHIYSKESLVDNALELLKRISQKAPLAITEIIDLVNARYSSSVDGFAKEVESFGKLFETSDFKEGVDAFLNKRTPNFEGN